MQSIINLKVHLQTTDSMHTKREKCETPSYLTLKTNIFCVHSSRKFVDG